MLLLGETASEANPAVREDLGVVFDAPFVLPDWTVSKTGRATAPFYSRWDADLFGALVERFHLAPKPP